MVARYHKKLNHSSVQFTLDDLFGAKRARVVYDLPCHIGYLAGKLNQSHFQYSADELIRNHTMYPLYEKFVPPDLAKNIYLRMLGDSRQNLQSVLGLTASNVPMLRRFKFCRECNAGSIAKYNDIYLNRVHQNQCIDVCHLHETPLIISNIDLKRNSQKGFVCLDEHDFNSVYPAEDLSGINGEHLIKIAKSFDYLLSGKFQCTFHQLRIRYLHLAKEHNLFHRGGINVRRLKTEFTKFYGDKLLARVGSEVNYKANNWLPAMFRQHRHLNHPIRHVLLMLFLASDIQSFCNFVPDGSVQCHEPRGNGQSINKHSRVDWAVRDCETLSKVKMAVKLILMSWDPFVRLSVHSVCGKTDEKDRILKSLNKLPLTKGYLDSVVETHIQFQYRKIDSVVKTYGKMKISEDFIYNEAAVVRNRYKEVDCYIKLIAAESSRGEFFCL